MIAFAIGFTPKGSTLASVVCLIFAWFLFTRMIYTFPAVKAKSRRQRFKVTGIASSVALVVIASFGWWLMPSLAQDRESEEVKKIGPAPTPQPTQQEQPDISARLVYPKGLAVLLVNESNVVLREPKYFPVLWNLDGEKWSNPLPIPAASGDWIRPGLTQGPNALITQPQISPLVKQGDRLFGAIQVSCPDCERVRAYWVYAIHGVGGWYADFPEDKYPDFSALMKLMPEIRHNPEQFFAEVSHDKRKPILESFLPKAEQPEGKAEEGKPNLIVVGYGKPPTIFNFDTRTFREGFADRGTETLVVEFRNAHERGKKISEAKNIRAHIGFEPFEYYEKSGRGVKNAAEGITGWARVDEGVWIGEAQPVINFAPGETKTLILASPGPDGTFHAYGHPIEHRPGTIAPFPRLHMLTAYKYVVKVQLTGGSQGEIAELYQFTVTLRPEFNISR